MRLLTKAQNRSKISLLHCSELQSIKQNYNEPAQLLCGEKWLSAACLRCANPRCIKFTDLEISCEQIPDFSYDRNYNFLENS